MTNGANLGINISYLDLSNQENLQIGEKLIDCGILTTEKVDSILTLQKQQLKRGEIKLFGDIAIELGILKPEQMIILLKTFNIRLRVGEILLNEGHISFSTLQEVIKEIQENTNGNKKLLEELERRGIINKGNMTDALSYQLSQDTTEEDFHNYFGDYLKWKERSENGNQACIPDSICIGRM